MKIKMMLFTAVAIVPAGIAFAQTDHSAHADPAATAGAQVQADTTAPAADAGVQAQAGAGAEAGAAGTEVAIASKEDIKAGASVVDPTGGAVGTVEKVTATGAVVSTGAARVEIPHGSFGKSDKGLVVAMTKAQLEAAAKGS